MQDEPLRILLVEDNPGDARLLRELVADAPHANISLTHVSRLSEALESLGQVRPDVVLLDLGLPDANGLDSVRQIHLTWPELAQVVLTGLDDNELAMRALQEGAQDYLTKGQIDGSLLLRAIRYAIERQKMRAALVSLALMDELTTLYNRRGFMALAEYQLKLARRGGRAFVLIYADIDDLKGINDTFGHAEGDRAIAETARILKESFRASDIFARLGGDEFCLLTVDAGADAAAVIRRRLTERLAAHNAESGRLYPLNFSIGVVCCAAEEPRDLSALLEEADRRMYEEKRKKWAGGQGAGGE